MVQATFPLTQAGAAQQKLENEHTQGKIVLDIAA
jgi:NADPH:quinone reductase-like Zn-dependent oxidoreductase